MGPPEDLLSQARQRLKIICLLGAAGYSFGIFLLHVITPSLLPSDAMVVLPRWQLIYTVIGGINICVYVAFFWYIPRTKRGLKFLLNLGIGLYLVSALSTGLIDYGIIPWSSVSYMPVLILLWAGLFPMTPARTLALSLSAASMDLVGASVWRATATEFPEHGRVLLQMMPNLLAAVYAVVISYVNTRLVLVSNPASVGQRSGR
jgi:hypothetical protein